MKDVNALLGLALLCHGNDDLSLFVSLVGIPVGFDDLLQRIAPVYGRSYLAPLNQLFEENQVFCSSGCWPKYDFLAASP